MPRGITADALSQAGNSQNQASSSYSTLAPLYSRLATNPQGYTPQQMADLKTATEQSAGGSMASAVGHFALLAARTGNTGAATAAIDDAARSAVATNSQNALDVQNQDALLQQQQQREGLDGLQGLYGTSTNAGLNYLNTALNASNSTTANAMGWTKIAGNFLRPGSQG